MEEIKPTYITFEQAKLLKKKGFDAPCIAFYDEEDNINEINYYCNANHNVTGSKSCWHNDLLSVTNTELDEMGAFCYKDEEETESYIRLTAPEQWMVVEWLRLNYGIWIYPYCAGINKFHYGIANSMTGSIITNSYRRNGNKLESLFAGYSSPQEAISAAFDYTLKELI